MRRFTELFLALEASNKTTARLAALEAYFGAAPPEDAVWALALLSGHRRRRYVGTTPLRTWAAQVAGVPTWLFDECYSAVGDLGETISLLVSPPGEPQSTRPLHQWMAELQGLKQLPEAEQQAYVQASWAQLSRDECFLFNKLVGGSFRVGVSTQLVARALARVLGVPEPTLAHRLMGDWQPTAAFYTSLRADSAAPTQGATPYPFYLAYPLDSEPDTLGPPEGWLAEWKWDGIRAQLVHRPPVTALWSRGEELITDRFPELAALGPYLPPGTVLDGELLPWADGGPLPFAALQRRIGRKHLTAKLLREVPVVLLAYDLLEWQGTDLRTAPLSERRRQLEALLTQTGTALPLRLSPPVAVSDWAALAATQQAARDQRAEGLMLKRLDSPYGVGRRRGDWWKWKLAPLSIDAVLVYAQQGTGRRASLYTDYTFAVWDVREATPVLVPFAKAYSGLTDAEIGQVDAFIRRNTQGRFGPVRTVAPELVFEIGFEGIQASPRHKSGVAVRFPRILRWRTDKPAAEADTLATLQALLSAYR
ncbi:MAG: ATP-dependent DNA ligase [Bacteroidia bacterium]|nr:ATP-dependent DNA ligase [Bacteroidia bacterium]